MTLFSQKISPAAPNILYIYIIYEMQYEGIREEMLITNIFRRGTRMCPPSVHSVEPPEMNATSV